MTADANGATLVVASFYPDIRGGAEVGLDAVLGGLGAAGAKHHTVSLASARRSEGVEGLGAVPPAAWRALLLGPPGVDARIKRVVGRAIARRSGIDVVHVWDTYAAIGSVAAAREAGLPVVATYHNSVGVPNRRVGVARPVGAWLDRRERRIIRAVAQADAVIAISGHVADGLAAAGVPRDRLHVVYVDGIVEVHASDRPSSSAFSVVAAGRFHAHKGFDLVVHAVRLLSNEGVNARLTLAGWGPDEARLRAAAEEHGVADRVTFVGRLAPDELAATFDEAADVVVVPSITPEPFGRVAVEAMSRGRPVVVSDGGGLREIVAGGGGATFTTGDAGALAAALATLARDPDHRRRLGAEAAERCRTVFSRSRVTNELVRVYERAAQRRAGGG